MKKPIVLKCPVISLTLKQTAVIKFNMMRVYISWAIEVIVILSQSFTDWMTCLLGFY